MFSVVEKSQHSSDECLVGIVGLITILSAADREVSGLVGPRSICRRGTARIARGLVNMPGVPGGLC